MLIEHQCARLQTAYAIAADQGDTEAFVQCFTEDGVVEVPGTPAFSGHAAIRASIVALGSLGVTYRHVITNSLITVETRDRAHGICYLVTFNSSAPADEAGSRPIEDPGTVGEYVDRFVRTSAGWRIRHRALRRIFRREDAVVRAAAELARRG